VRLVPDGSLPLRKYAEAQAETLIRRFVFEVSRTIKRRDANSIHDLRVAVRRLDQCLETFGPLFPKGEARKVSKRVDAIRKLAGDVRNRDVAIEYLVRLEGTEKIIVRLRAERKRAIQALHARLAAWATREPWRKWRRRLEI
jgi:CHAD domain-containing protein